MEIVITLLALAGSGLLTYALYWVKTYYLTKQRLDQIQQAEFSATNFVQAAEQKFNLVLDTTEQIVTPEQKALIAAERKKFNENKKKYVMDRLKLIYPDLNVEILDGLTESAVNYYKQRVRERGESLTLRSTNGSGLSNTTVLEK